PRSSTSLPAPSGRGSPGAARSSWNASDLNIRDLQIKGTEYPPANVRTTMADDERSAEIAGGLEVEPLDDVTRRRLVSSALRETETADAPAPGRPSRTWRWIAAAAALVIVAVGTLAVVSANGGHDE